MQCPKCGSENRESAKFCKGCGFKVEVDLAQALPVQAASASCLHCGCLNRPTVRFCSACGKPMVAADATPTAAPATRAQVSPPRPARIDAPVRSAAAHALPVDQSQAREGAGKLTYVVAAVAAIAVAAGGAYYWTQLRNPAASAAPVAAPALAPTVAPAAASASEPVATPPIAVPPAEPAPLDTPGTSTSSTPAPAPAPLPTATPVTRPEISESAKTAPPPPSTKAPPQSPVPKPLQAPPPPRAQPVGPAATPAATTAPEARAATVPAPPPVPQAEASSEPDWYVRLKSELANCRGKSNAILGKLCEEAAKVRYCAPANRWGKVPECPQAQQPRSND